MSISFYEWRGHQTNLESFLVLYSSSDYLTNEKLAQLLGKIKYKNGSSILSQGPSQQQNLPAQRPGWISDKNPKQQQQNVNHLKILTENVRSLPSHSPSRQSGNRQAMGINSLLPHNPTHTAQSWALILCDRTASAGTNLPLEYCTETGHAMLTWKHQGRAGKPRAPRAEGSCSTEPGGDPTSASASPHAPIPLTVPKDTQTPRVPWAQQSFCVRGFWCKNSSATIQGHPGEPRAPAGTLRLPPGPRFLGRKELTTRHN